MARVAIVAGLGFGDEGKGSVVDGLCRQMKANLVVRYNGGAQCGHNVVLPDGRHHCFAQFGSGSFIPGVETHLSRFMLVNPVFMEAEAKRLIELGVMDIWDRITVERDALITNPFQVAANRLREMYRRERHGSCGMGIGETQQDALTDPEATLRAGDLLDPELTTAKLLRSQARKLAEIESIPRRTLANSTQADLEWFILQDKTWAKELAYSVYKPWATRVRLVTRDYLPWKLSEGENAVFEGAQGVLLDENYGFHPHTTWSTTTFRNAYALLDGYTGESVPIGVMRPYMTRHGAGPMPTEDSALSFQDHNEFGEWQQGFRFGYFDDVLYRYATSVLACSKPVNEPPLNLAITHLDQVHWPIKFAAKYKVLNSSWHKLPLPESIREQEQLTDLLQTVSPVYEEVTSVEDLAKGYPIMVKSMGPTWQDKQYAN